LLRNALAVSVPVPSWCVMPCVISNSPFERRISPGPHVGKSREE
jgi:hypothetical protein